MTWNSLYRVMLKFAIARSTDYWIASCWFWLHAEKWLVVQAAEKLAFGRVSKGHGFQLAEKLPFEGFRQGTTSSVPLSPVAFSSRACELGSSRSAVFALRGVMFSPRGMRFSGFFSSTRIPLNCVFPAI